MHKTIFSRDNVLIGISIAIITVALWGYLNRPEQEPPWPKHVQGFSFSPFRENQDAIKRIFPTQEEIDRDLALLSGKAYAVRTYSQDDVYEKIPEMAKAHGLNVTLGAWIDARRDNNEIEIAKLIDAVRKNKNVVRVIVGNEALLRGDVTIEEMNWYLDRVRSEMDIPVSTAEPWHVWIKHPELAEHADFLAVHMLPYWEGIDVDSSIDYIVQHMNGLKALFPDKPVVITEVGWPSNGRTRLSAVASVSNQAKFLRRFLARAEKEKYTYYIMEAFDQPWKTDSEGAVGAYWGVYNVYREPKFSFTSPISAITNWYVLAALSVIIAGITLAILFTDSSTLKRRGRSFLAVIAYAAATFGVWIVYQYIHQYLTVTSVVVGILMLMGMIGVILVLLTEAHEWAEAIWVSERRRSFKPVLLAEEDLPFISIHVPAYNEPPEMMIETLNALAELDYPKFEVIVIDNNTKDPAVWKPVMEHCEKLGSRFRFFHEDTLTGFKAGALNYAARQTAKEAEVIGVIDSDYKVDKNWLKDLASQFLNPKIAIVQAPQDYRDEKESFFKTMCYAEYSGFFFIGMVTRNERNAIIQHGTMTLVRRSVLEEVGGWSEWCITEDAEMGLKVFENGYEAIYIPKSYGRGVMPDTFMDYKKQRFRWAYGAIIILKKHSSVLFGRAKSALTRGQKYHFIAGWLPWVADAANMIFNFAALVWTMAMLIDPKHIDPPLFEFAVLPLVLFSFKIGKLIYLYRTRSGSNIFNISAAALAGISLSHTIASAVIRGIFTDNQPFVRTPKMAKTNRLFQALTSVREEGLFMFALLLAAFALLATQQGIMTLDMHVWIIVLFIQSVPYASAVVVSFVSAKRPLQHV